MKNRIPRFTLLAFCGFAILNVGTSDATGAPIPTRQALFFRNGDVVVGSLESIRADKSVVWKRSDVSQPLEFSGTNLVEAKFFAERKAASSGTNGCKVYLSNGDVFAGVLSQLDSENLTLATSCAGTMIFPRKSVITLESLPQEGRAIFSGPTGLDGWIMGKVTIPAAGDTGDWRYTNGAFYATRSASIARDLKLPDEARIEFDLAWKSTLQAAVALYTSYMQPINLANKEAEPQFGGFYSLQLNSFMASLLPVKQNSPLLFLGQMHVPTFSQKNRAHFELLTSKPGGRVILLVDGLLIKEWIDPDGFAGSGTGMRFVHQGQGALKLSNLRIAEWNGKIEQKSTNVSVLKEDIARLLNGDKVSGKLESFRDGKLVFATAKTKLEIPFSRVADVKFPRGAKDDETKSLVRAFFPDGGSATFRLERWDNSGAAGTSPNFGHATFAPNTFEKVEFYPGPLKKAAPASVPTSLLQ
ncbi:MAG: hypothetical protein ABIQ35_03135 [Verrucomicrobiota bacterium]